MRLIKENPEVFIVWVILVLINLVALVANGEEPGDERGCIATYLPSSGKFAYEPFLKVQSKESFSEDGKPEVWGFRLWNLEPPDKDGKTHPVNVLEETWIPISVWKEIPAGTMKRRIHCPPYWKGNSGMSAER